MEMLSTSIDGPSADGSAAVQRHPMPIACRSRLVSCHCGQNDVPLMCHFDVTVSRTNTQ